MVKLYKAMKCSTKGAALRKEPYASLLYIFNVFIEEVCEILLFSPFDECR